MDASSIPQPWYNGLFTALAGLVFYIYRKLDRKVDKISGDYVTRKELTDAIALHNASVQQMHLDNTRNFAVMQNQLQSMNDKLFDLSGRIPK
jgi:hypothetical protein